MGTKSLAVTLYCLLLFVILVLFYGYSVISCVLRGAGSRLMFVVFAPNVTYTPNVK